MVMRLYWLKQAALYGTRKLTNVKQPTGLLTMWAALVGIKEEQKKRKK